MGKHKKELLNGSDTNFSNAENTKSGRDLQICPFEKAGMTMEGESNVVLVMPLLALSFSGDLSQRVIISTIISTLKD